MWKTNNLSLSLRINEEFSDFQISNRVCVCVYVCDAVVLICCIHTLLEHQWLYCRTVQKSFFPKS